MGADLHIAMRHGNLICNICNHYFTENYETICKKCKKKYAIELKEIEKLEKQIQKIELDCQKQEQD